MRSLKALGLVFVAALALSAMVASGASAATVTGGPLVHGEDTVEGLHAFTGVTGVECEEATYSGTGYGSYIVVGLDFEECVMASISPVTITDNGCSYAMVLGALNELSAPASASLVCPPGQQVVLHAYPDEPHTTSSCTIEIPPQTGLSGLTVTAETSGSLFIEGSVGGVTNYIAGACATAASAGVLETLNPGNATLHVSIELTDEEEELGLE